MGCPDPGPGGRDLHGGQEKVRDKIVARGKPKRADYILFYWPICLWQSSKQRTTTTASAVNCAISQLRMKKTYPPIRSGKYVNEAPHVVLLGAGASRAAFPQGDRNGRILPVMRELADVVGLDDVLNREELSKVRSNFEALFDQLKSDPLRRDTIDTVEKRLVRYFHQLEIPSEVTLYDKILLSLRAKDLVATFNWDPLLVQAFRRNVSVEELPRIIFLHGCVAVGTCVEHRCKGYIDQECPQCGTQLQAAPLLYPVRDKDYRASPFIANEWEELTRALKRAFIVTIIGYSAPTTDEAARALLHEAFGANSSRDFAQVEITDIEAESTLRLRWNQFVVRNHYSTSPTSDRAIMFVYARRSCDALAWAILQQDPWHERPLPLLDELAELQHWVRPLVLEEQRYAQDDEAFHPYRGGTLG